MISPVSFKSTTWILIIICMICAAMPSRCLADDTRNSLSQLIAEGEEAYARKETALAIKKFMEAAEKADKAADTEMSCLAYYNMGVAYMGICENGQAISNFKKAYEICMSHNIGPKREVEIVAAIAGVYYMQQDYGKAYSQLNKAWNIAETNHDSVMLALLTQNMALLSNKQKRFDDAAEWISKAGQYAPVSEETRVRYREIEAETAMLRGDLGEADDIARSLLETSDSVYTNKGLMFSYRLEVALRSGKWREALGMLKGGIPEINLLNKVYFYHTLAEIYTRAGDFRKVAEAKDSVILYKDSMERINNRQLIENSDTALEVMTYKLDADRKLARQKMSTTVWISIACIFLLLFLMSGMAIRYQRQRNRTNQEVMRLQYENEHHEKQLAEERMKETELIAAHQQEMLRKEIERKNTEMQANAMFISSRNELIEDILKYLGAMGETTETAEIRQLTQHLRRLLCHDGRDREELLTNLEASDPDFSRKVLAVHPGLLQSDIKFLSYIKMNMSMKEIAAILNINPDSCKRRKIRISKKLGLDTSADLYQYLLTL